jgi:hypothetical protein
LIERQKVKENFDKFNFQARVAFINASVHAKTQKHCSYFLFGKKICRDFFLKTLGISAQAVITSREKFNETDTTDKRGKHGNHKMLSEEKRQAVIAHVRSFPAYCSHYNRESSSSLYLDPSLNISIMHRLFLVQWKATRNENSVDPEDKAPAYDFYHEVFTALGYKFKPLKTDTCKLCDGLDMKISSANEPEKSQLRKLLDDHHKLADRANKEMTDDLNRAKIEKIVRCMVIDLQKVLILPKAPTNDLYYTRNFNCLNLNIHENNNGNFHTWTEIDGGRGAREVGSCILKHITGTWCDDTEEIILWGDSCGGQNRNFIVAVMLLHFLKTQPNSKLKKISFKFLVSGHSYNACDRDFAVFEKCIKKQQIISTPADYIDLMLKCKIKNPFKVTVMTSKDFLDPAALLGNVTKRDIDRTSKVQVSWIKSREFMLNIDQPFSIFLRYDFDGSFYELNYGKIKRARKVENIVSKNWNELKYKILYPKGKQITEAKKKDLIKVSQFLPPSGRAFIEEITQKEAANFMDDIDGYSLDECVELREYTE